GSGKTRCVMLSVSQSAVQHGTRSALVHPRDESFVSARSLIVGAYLVDPMVCRRSGFPIPASPKQWRDILCATVASASAAQPGARGRLLWHQTPAPWSGDGACSKWRPDRHWRFRMPEARAILSTDWAPGSVLSDE